MYAFFYTLVVSENPISVLEAPILELLKQLLDSLTDSLFFTNILIWYTGLGRMFGNIYHNDCTPLVTPYW